ncbi:Breast cancer metastasis-suppressor [Fasciola hepatica]|uniref:Breast cancer metastasis-suppressor n=1 Tax=Fasciola hepatica TaxID=6192 RepID=A0A4E0RXI0_FASHE|nr:Breast cancer metastasis-suppressor [Fasciola hepatica]
MSTDQPKTQNASTRDEDEDHPMDEDYAEQENRSELSEEDLTEVELECLRRELTAEVAELEWEFKHAKETLYNERIAQVNNKLAQAKDGSAPEFLHVVSLVEETYRIRRQVAECRRDFAIEVANKELDNELQTARCIMNERLLVAEDQIRRRLQESLCRLQVERAAMTLHNSSSTTTSHKSRSTGSPFSGDSADRLDAPTRTALATLDPNLYLPSPNLEPRKKPITLSPTTPRLVYQLPEEDIRADVETIMAAVKEHKLALAMTEMNGGKRLC